MSDFRSIGDLSSSLRLRHLNARLKADAGRLGAELASGRAADMVRRTNGDLGRLNGFEHGLGMLKAYGTAASEFLTLASAMQTALGAVEHQAADTGATLVAASNTLTSASLGAGADAAREGFRAAVGALNTSIAGRALFAGRAFDTPALAGADTMLAELEGLTGGAADAGAVRAIVADYFDDPGGGFQTSGYLGSAETAGTRRISPTETARADILASDPALREVLKGLATAALAGGGGPSLDLSARADLLRGSGEALLTAVDGVVDLQAALGATEARVEAAEVASSAEASALETTRNAAIAADPYRTATELQNVEIQLEALYLATSRLSQMTLARYLR
ncbi:MAG: hypothetical protein KDK00_03070 [Rhodobacteraceae bacterium]|nr:hypothetical protein [Paracoccaceae bacterium]